ncbi:hypothetical protein T440DRAFT_46802 [Plenodomus tracheiphilus IPT5]|uniref:Uncharacterized protein n=1 Tax=Plenodomus tracheiphilus IPT5 TaxID=1408161 RepID=A0A6A7BCL5_9PLEO|nr:hypothetical protein T440DRAFT_46802 [Plenodomus tracheiphilus IPT5]
MAAQYSRRPSHLEAPLSPSIIPDLAILPQPLPAEQLPCGQLVSKASKHTPKVLEDRDFDDVGTRWYKDVIFFDASTGHFTESFGGAHLVQKPLDKGTEAGTIEAEEQHVRLLKDADAALQKVWKDEEAKKWIKSQDEAGFVVAHREVSNASYKRASLLDVGNGNWEVIREVGGEDHTGKRRDSALPIETNSKWDVVGVLVRKIVIDGDEVKLGEELGAEYWN